MQSDESPIPRINAGRQQIPPHFVVGTERGRKVRSDLKVGICGEHGGDPASIAFFHAAGLDYVSCSPFRVPVARLAAAQAAIWGKTGAEPRSQA